MSKTEDALKEAFAGESMANRRYLYFAKVADVEGYPEVALVFRNISKVEAHHEARYLALMNNIQMDKVFKKDKVVKWKCRNCGYIHEGAGAPELCPACAHPKAYFELQDTNW